MLNDVRWGAKWGLACGVAFGCITALILLLKEELPRGVSPVVIVLSYPVAGFLAGTAVGFMRRFLTTRRNSMVVGAVTGVMVMLMLAPLANGPPTSWDGAGFASALILGVIIGALGARSWWGIFVGEGGSTERESPDSRDGRPGRRRLR